MVVVGGVSRFLEIAERSSEPFDLALLERGNERSSVLRLPATPSGYPLAGVLERLVRKRAREPKLILLGRVRSEMGGRLIGDRVVHGVVRRGHRSAQPDRAGLPLTGVIVRKLAC